MGRLWKSVGLHLTSLRLCSTATAAVLNDFGVSGDVSGVAFKPYSDIPGPRPLPIVGNAWRFLPLIGQYSLGELDRAMVDLRERYGRMARLSGLLGHPDLLFVFDPEDIEQVFRAEDALESTPCRPPMPSIAYYKRTLRGDFFGDTPGVIGIHGALWHSFRTKVNKVMLTANAAKNFTEELDAVAMEFTNRISEMRDENNELPHDFLNELYKWSLESLGVTALGARLGCLQQPAAGAEQQQEADVNSNSDSEGTRRLLCAVRTFFETVAVVELRKPYSRWLNTRDWRRYVAALDVFREECMRRVTDAAAEQATTAAADAGVADSSAEQAAERRRRRRGPTSLLRQVLERTGDPRLAAVLAMDLMLVGLDTSSVSAATCLYLLARNPAAQDRLFAELRRLLPRPDSPVNAATADQMHYLRACVREALRIYPVIIGNGRCLTKDTVIGGHLVPRGVHVIFPHLVTGNDAGNGVPDPHLFLPERWLQDSRAAGCPAGGGSATTTARPHPFASVPFGFGRRMCLGRRLAEHQLLLLLARTVRRFGVEHHHEDFQYEVTPVYAPKNALKFRLLERSQ